MSRHLALSPRMRRFHHRAELQPLAAGSQGSIWPTPAARYGGSVEPPLLLCLTVLLCAPQRQPQGGKWRRDRELQLLSSLPSSLAVFLWLFVMPPLLRSLPEATAPWCMQIPLGWICLWCAYHKVCHHLRERGWLIVALQTEGKENKHIELWYVFVPVKPYSIAAKSLLHVFVSFFCCAACEEAVRCCCRYSCPQKWPDTDLDQVDKLLPSSICPAGSDPGAKGHMGRNCFLHHLSPSAWEWGKMRLRDLWGSSVLLPSCGQM